MTKSPCEAASHQTPGFMWRRGRLHALCDPGARARLLRERAIDYYGWGLSIKSALKPQEVRRESRNPCAR
jgi:hypothetical protein